MKQMNLHLVQNMRVQIAGILSLAAKVDYRAANACTAEFLALSTVKMERQRVFRVLREAKDRMTFLMDLIKYSIL